MGEVRLCFHTAQDADRAMLTPLTHSRTPLTVVGTSTFIVLPLSGSRVAGGARVDRPPAGLMRRAQKGIRSTSDTQAQGPGEFHQRRTVREIGGQWFLGIRVLAGVQYLLRYRGVRHRYGQVHDDGDLGV